MLLRPKERFGYATLGTCMGQLSSCWFPTSALFIFINCLYPASASVQLPLLIIAKMESLRWNAPRLPCVLHLPKLAVVATVLFSWVQFVDPTGFLSWTDPQWRTHSTQTASSKTPLHPNTHMHLLFLCMSPCCSESMEIIHIRCLSSLNSNGILWQSMPGCAMSIK